MDTLTTMFQNTLDWGLSALPVVLAVLAARLLLLKLRCPKWSAYALWSVVGFRLLYSAIGMSLPSPVSVYNAPAVRTAQTAAENAVRDLREITVPSAFTQAAPAMSAPAAPGTPSAYVAPEIVVADVIPVMEILALIWAVGLAALLVWMAVSYFKVRRSVRQAVLLEKNVYECDGLTTPFVLGTFFSKIYIPFHMEADERAYILLHERTHILRGDPKWKLLAFLLLALYWWNPALWLCYFLFCRDMEMSCDEAVLKKLGPEVKRAYSLSLVGFATGRRFSAAGPLAFGEGDAKSRVKNVLRWKRAAAPLVFLAIAACVLVAAVCGTDAPASSGGWVQAEGTASAGGRTDMKFSYNLPEEINSYLFYEEIYGDGELLSQGVVAAGDFDSGEVPLPRRGSVSIGGYGLGEAGWSFSHDFDGAGGATFTTPITLPERSYQGSAGPDYLGLNSKETRWPLGEVDVVAALTLSDDDGHLSGPTVDFSNFTPDTLFEDGYTDVAAVLRVAFSRLDAESFRREFEENGPGSGGALLGDNWIKSGLLSEGSTDGQKSIEARYKYETNDPAVQWIQYYEDVFVEGELVSSEELMGLGPAGEPVKSDITAAVSVDLANGAMVASLLEGGGTQNHRVSLPAGPYSACDFRTLDRRVALDTLGAAGSVTLLTANFLYADHNPAKSSYDVSVRLRMELSNQPWKPEISPEAQALYDLRTPYAGDGAAAGKLLSALGVGDLGVYTLELFTSEHPYTLQVNFRDVPADIDPTSPSIDKAMTKNAALLLALVGNLEQVNWSYPSREDGQETLITVYNPLDNTSAPYGWTIEECGESANGIDTLVDFYDAANNPPITAAEWCLADPGTVGNWANWMMDGEDMWNVSLQEDGAFKAEFYNRPADPAALDQRMERAALLILALDGETDAVQWYYPRTDGDPAPGAYVGREPSGSPSGRQDVEIHAYTPADADAKLQELGGALAGKSIRDFGKSPEALQPLLDWVYAAQDAAR